MYAITPSDDWQAVMKYRALINKAARRATAARLARFCGVGAACLVIATAGLAALHDLAGMYYLTAYVISFCLGNVLGYLLNGRFTFVARISAAGGARYLLLNTALLGINTVLMKALVDGVHIWYIAACLFLAVTTTPFSYILHRKFSYTVQSAESTSLAESPR